MSVLQVVDRKLSIDPAEEGIFSKSHGQIVFTHTTTTIMHGQWTNTAVKVKGQQLWTLAVRAPGGLTSSKGPFSSIAATTSSIILFGQIPVRFENLIMTRLESDCRWRRMASEEHWGQMQLESSGRRLQRKLPRRLPRKRRTRNFAERGRSGGSGNGRHRDEGFVADQGRKVTFGGIECFELLS